MAKRFNDCPPLLQDFLYYMLTIRGRSQKTVDAYHTDLRTFFRYIKSVKFPASASELDFNNIKITDIDIETIKKITLSDAYGFLSYAMDERENKSRACSRKVSCIRSFFKYLTSKTGLLSENPVKDLETPSLKKSLPKYLTLEESIELMSNVNTSNPQRDYCIITMFLNCGMRLSELVGININDIRDNTVKLLGKGNKERLVYLNDSCTYALAQYLDVRKTPVKASEKNALFLSERGTRLSARRVEQIVETCLKQAGLSDKGYSPHKLRHTAATLMYQHGGIDIRVLKEVLGHANLSTTEIYTHVSDTQIEKAAKASPLSKITIRK